jgi:hypothetical protein
MRCSKRWVESTPTMSTAHRTAAGRAWAVGTSGGALRAESAICDRRWHSSNRPAWQRRQAALAEQLGEESEAEALYRQSSDPTVTRPGRDPRSPAQRLGLLLLRQGRSAEAVKVLQAARWKLLEQSTPSGSAAR